MTAKLQPHLHVDAGGTEVDGCGMSDHIAEQIAARLTGQFYVGQRVRLLYPFTKRSSQTIGTVTAIVKSEYPYKVKWDSQNSNYYPAFHLASA